MARMGALTLLALFCGLALLTGYNYYKYYFESPDVCVLCHPMEEGYKAWNASKHNDIICQRCHKLTAMEGNRLLFRHFALGQNSVNENHGRIEPWAHCLECHESAAYSGSMTLRKSHGHARHVFIKGMQCDACHTADMRTNFKPDQSRCLGCHPDRLVHGMGTTGMRCLNCHNFLESATSPVSEEKCIVCHKDIKMGKVMAQLKCFDCHHPHDKLKLLDEDCMSSCHANQVRVGQHGLHLQQGMKCLGCHKPHEWSVTPARARGLCDRCHALRNPNAFIY